MYQYLKLIFFCLFASLNLQLEAQNAVKSFAENPDLKGALVSVAIADIATGEILESQNIDQRLCPASVWKLFTTSAAIKILGSDFRFHTVLAYQGNLVNGILDGNIFIIGGGDPSLGSRFFDQSFEGLLNEWTTAIRKAGIDSIHGKIVANAVHFTGDGIPRTRIWEDMANYYGAAVSGLNINDNTYYVDFEVPSDLDQKARILSVKPEVPGLQITSEVLSSKTLSDQAFIFGSPFDNERVVRGTLPAGRQHFEIKGSLPNPPLFAAWHLENALEKSGVGVSDGISVELTTLHERATLKVISTHESPPLSELVAHTNIESDNLFAEIFLYQIGAKNGDPTLQGGLDALNEFYEPVCADSYPFYAYDGSGLSRFTAVSSGQIIQLLSYDAQDDILQKNLLEKLPMAGIQGSMKWFGNRTNLQANLRGKSGSMEKVKAYAGVFTGLTGRQLAFAVLVNNFDGSPNHIKDLIEKMLLKAYGDY